MNKWSQSWVILPIGFLTACIDLDEHYRKDDCTQNDTEIACAPGWSCHPGTKHCEQVCSLDSDCQNNGEKGKGMCRDGWCRSCAGSASNTVISESEGQSSSCFCKQHSDCSSNLCDIYKMTDFNVGGTCVSVWKYDVPNNKSIRNIIYVDPMGCVPGVPQDGSQQYPYCEIAQALHRNIQDHYSYYIRVRGRRESYGLGTVPVGMPTPLIIIGPDASENAKSGQEFMLDSPVILDGDRLTSSFSLTIEGGRILNNVTGRNVYGISCTATNTVPILELRRMIIGPTRPGTTLMSDAALYGKNCDLRLDRSAIIDNSGNALILEGDVTKYVITNSIILNNKLLSDSPKPSVVLGGAGVFDYNTIVGNGNPLAVNPFPAGVECKNSGRLDNSIVFQNQTKDKSQFVSNGMAGCKFSKVVAGEEEATKADNLINRNPTFVVENSQIFSTDRLAISPIDKVCRVIDQGIPMPDTSEMYRYWLWDFQGNERKSYIIGAVAK